MKRKRYKFCHSSNEFNKMNANFQFNVLLKFQKLQMYKTLMSFGSLLSIYNVNVNEDLFLLH